MRSSKRDQVRNLATKALYQPAVSRRRFLGRTCGATFASAFLLGESSSLAHEEPSQSEPLKEALPEHDPVAEMYATGFADPTGLAVDSSQNLLVSNYRLMGAIGRIQKDGTAGVLCDLREASPVEGLDPTPAGMKIDIDDRLVVADAGTGRLLRISRDGSQVDLLADRCEGRRFYQLQDVALDIVRNVFFTDRGKARGKESTGAAYRHSANTGKITRIDDQLVRPSGIAVTPDQNRLCIAESGRQRILIYELSNDGKASNRQTLLALPQTKEEEGATDNAVDNRESSLRPLNLHGLRNLHGMVFDLLGRLYVTTPNGLIYVIDLEQKKIVRQYYAGGQEATSCHFHGGFLYTAIASKEAVFRLHLGVEGFAYNGSA